MSNPPNAADPTDQPDPSQDRAAEGNQAAGRIAGLVGLVRKLISYGKELATTLQQRTPATCPRDLNYCFGTIDIALILAHITRGLHRAAALEARLLDILARPRAQPASPARVPTQRKPRPARPAAPPGDNADPKLARMPTPADIAAQARRRRIGTVIADLCRDLGITWNHPLWQELNLAIIDHGGNAMPLIRAFLKRPIFSPDIDPSTPLIPPMPEGWRPPPRLSFAEALGIDTTSDVSFGTDPAFELPAGTGPP